MNRDASSGGRSGRRLQHHLEDQADRDLDRFFGAGKARRRDRDRRGDQYAHLAARLFDLALRGELADPVFEDVVLERVELHSGSSLLTAWVCSTRPLDEEERAALVAQFDPAARFLRTVLTRELPRKRVPVVRMRLAGEER